MLSTSSDSYAYFKTNLLYFLVVCLREDMSLPRTPPSRRISGSLYLRYGRSVHYHLYCKHLPGNVSDHWPLLSLLYLGFLASCWNPANNIIICAVSRLDNASHFWPWLLNKIFNFCLFPVGGKLAAGPLPLFLVFSKIKEPVYYAQILPLRNFSLLIVKGTPKEHGCGWVRLRSHKEIFDIFIFHRCCRTLFLLEILIHKGHLAD